MNTREIVQRAARDLLEHRHKLSGKADEAERARATTLFRLTQEAAATALAEG